MPFTPKRVSGFSYRGLYRYFVTVCAWKRTSRFLEAPHTAHLCAQLSPFFERYGFDVVAYCFMPDHAHLLLEGTAPDADFREAMRQWKQQTSHVWRARTGQPLWQLGYYDRVLRENDDTRAVVAYLLQNPVRAGLVAAATDWPWTGSAKYPVLDLAIHAGDWNPPWR